MTHIAFKNKPFEKSFNNLLDDFLPQFSSIVYDHNPLGVKNVPVNILEKENEFVIDVIAPGWEKQDFKISLDKGLLTISAEAKNETKNNNLRQVRREFSFSSFKRSFTVDDKVNVENIAAQYLNGVLRVSLPKKEEVKVSPKEIEIL
ncbi:MAG: Hsp20/alpha crystallin family protein [Flavisolibacter sp.]